MQNQHRICVAPMMKYTDRHFRYLIRLLSRHTMLYTEMVTSHALLHGDVGRLLRYAPIEHPIALQLGGSDPEQLRHCARLAEEWGYDEVNLNVGCPSDRVQSGRFGACLMAEPELVAECVHSMQQAVSIPVTVKTRIGIDKQDDYQPLEYFTRLVNQAGCKVLIVHARKAWLKGLSPKENRNVPPLRYPTVYQLKRDFPEMTIVINGGIKTLEECEQHLTQVDGVMLGRVAYQDPFLFASVDQAFYHTPIPLVERLAVIDQMREYISQEMQVGCALPSLLKPLIGLFQGLTGARAWRRCLTDQQLIREKGIKIFDQALSYV